MSPPPNKNKTNKQIQNLLGYKEQGEEIEIVTNFLTVGQYKALATFFSEPPDHDSNDLTFLSLEVHLAGLLQVNKKEERNTKTERQTGKREKSWGSLLHDGDRNNIHTFSLPLSHRL